MTTTTKHAVLLVDDEPQILVALEDLLSDAFTIFTASSAEEALDVIQSESDIAVVVTDQRMPKMPGDELVAKIQESSRAQRILVTGYADLTAVIKAVNDGRIFAYVKKPWDEEELRLKVNQAANHFQLARELDAERQLLHDLMNNSPDGIFFKDIDLRFKRVNRAFANWLDLPSEELVGRPLCDLNTPFRDVPALEQFEKKVIQEGTPVLDVLSELRRPSGETRWVSEVRAPIHGATGEVAGLVGISRDVTTQLQLEQQLTQSQKMEAVGRLAGGVAHDFNNLLAIIQGYACLVMDTLGPEHETRPEMEELFRATERAAALTKQLLGLGRRRTKAAAVTNLNLVVDEVTRMLRRVIGERISIVVRPGPPAVTIRADPTQVEQVILNLAINARDAMPDGGTLTLEVGVSTKSAHRGAPVRLSVSDTGTGMSSEVKAKIFEPFFSTKEIGKGTGLGLSTVYGIVKQTGGQISVETSLGHGTRFDVFWPVAGPSISEEPKDKSSRSSQVGGETVLIVEDEEAVRRVTARILKQRGYKTLEVSTPSQAIALFTEGRQTVDLLLTDVIMPEMLGPSLYKRLSAMQPGLRVLFMSGYTGDSTEGTEIPAGATLIEKPFRPDALATEVRRALDR
jgi:PAS domain S-box-containing protein